MKKLFLLATALLAMVGCKDDEVVNQEEEPKVDKISVLPEAKEFDNNGGSVSVMITSSGEWTLSTKDNATYDWVSTDKTAGADGDMIKFTVSPNETEEARHAYYVFTSGKATAEFKITSFAGEILKPSITVDETEIVKDYNAGQFRLKVKYSEGVNYRDIKAVIPEQTTWLRYQATLEGDEDGQAEMAFEYDVLEGLESRSVEFNVNYSAEEAVNIPVKMTQMPEPVLIPERSKFIVPLAGGTLSVKVTSSVAYTAEVLGDGASWLTGHNLNDDGTNTWACSPADGRREATIKFTEAAPAEGKEPLVEEVTVVQVDALITTVARMNDHRAVFSSYSSGNKDKFKLGKKFTVEFLINPDKGSFNSVSAMFGIERRFLIRHSDIGKPGKWEVVCVKNRKDYNGEHIESKFTGSTLDAGKWTHIAVVLDGETITLYQDGIQKNKQSLDNDMKDVDLTETYMANRALQQFAIGYAYDNGRFFNGQMSEVRVWNRALSADEITATNHFYKVETDAEGLVAYWKMDDGEGSTFKDSTSNGNNLTGEKYNGKWNEADIVWEGVTLPE